jgi:hypothetical protein
MTIMIQVAHVPGQHSVGMSMNKGDYVVSYGLKVKTFRRTPSGLSAAVKEFEECYAQALTCAADEIDDEVFK